MKYIRTVENIFKQKYTYLYILGSMGILYVTSILFSQGINIWNSTILDIPFLQKINVLTSYFTSYKDSFSYTTLILLLVTGCVIGAQFALVRLYAKNKLLLPERTLTITSIISSLLGCMACCGSIVFSLLSGLIGVSIQAVLPFGGAEFSFIGLGISILAFFLTLHAYHKPQVC